MIVKNAELETVCGITSKLPENVQIRSGICRKVKCRGKVFSDQWTDEPKVSCTYQLGTGKDADHQFLCRDRTQRDEKKEAQGMVSADEKVYLVDLPAMVMPKFRRTKSRNGAR